MINVLRRFFGFNISQAFFMRRLLEKRMRVSFFSFYFSLEIVSQCNSFICVRLRHLLCPSFCLGISPVLSSHSLLTLSFHSLSVSFSLFLSLSLSFSVFRFTTSLQTVISQPFLGIMEWNFLGTSRDVILTKQEKKRGSMTFTYCFLGQWT